MDFKCFICQKCFSTFEKTLSHLKKVHQIRNNSQDLKCIVNNDCCYTTVRTFRGLKKHSANCIKSKKISDIEEQVGFTFYAKNYKIIQFNSIQSNLICIQLLECRLEDENTNGFEQQRAVQTLDDSEDESTEKVKEIKIN